MTTFHGSLLKVLKDAVTSYERPPPVHNDLNVPLSGYISPSKQEQTDTQATRSDETFACPALESIRESLEEKVEQIRLKHAETEGNIDLGGATLGRADIIADGKIWTMHQYLGKDHSKRITDLHNSEPIQTNMLLTDLMPHQAKGVTKLLKMFQGPHYGGILGDEMGLGKTLATLLAIMIDGKTRRGSFSLVVAPKSVTQQWVDECNVHFKPEYRPRCFVLTDNQMTTEELLEKKADIVIVTPQLVAAQYQRWIDRDLIASEIEKKGMGALQTVESPQNWNPPALSLFSSVYANRLLPFKHLIVDEAQYGKNHEGKTHVALNRLYRTCTLLISGTFMANRWSDIYTFIDFLPGHPFKTKKDFSRICGQDRQGPQASQFAVLTKFLQAIVVARPNSVMKLEGALVEDVSFELDPDAEDQVIDRMLRWFQLMQMVKAAKLKGGADEDRMDQLALSQVQRAQVCAGHILCSLDKPKTAQQQREIKQTARRFREAMKESLKETSRTNSPLENEHFKEHVYDAYHVLESNMLPLRTIMPPKTNPNTARTTTDEPDKKPKETREAWIKRVRKLDKNELASARIRKVSEVILECFEKHPNEKIVVFSKYLKLLDVLSEYFRKTGGGPVIYRFDGEMDLGKRAIAKWQFENAPSDQPTVIMVTTGAGGAGVNLTAASVVIQMEPWWNGNEEMQAWFRVRRPGQEKFVHIYRFMASNSLVDYHIHRVRNQKAETILEIMNQLRRPDEEQPVIPDVVIQY